MVLEIRYYLLFLIVWMSLLLIYVKFIVLGLIFMRLFKDCCVKFMLMKEDNFERIVWESVLNVLRVFILKDVWYCFLMMVRFLRWCNMVGWVFEIWVMRFEMLLNMEFKSWLMFCCLKLLRIFDVLMFGCIVNLFNNLLVFLVSLWIRLCFFVLLLFVKMIS